MSTPAASKPRGHRRGIAASWPMLLVAAAVICAIVWLRRHEPSYTERVAPVHVPGVLGARIEARNFAVTVPEDGLYAARAIGAPPASVFSQARVQLRTPGVWLSVPARIEALREPGVVSAQLRSRDGLIYQSSGSDRPKLDALNLDTRMLAAGLPEHGRWFFELPADRLEGLRLQVYWGALTPQQNDALVDIDLHIDAERARDLRARAPALLELRP
jgi:hypothetical protein